MESFKNYLVEKKALLEKMELLREKLESLQKFDIDCSEELRKIEQTLASIDKEEISVVLVGSFSDGKTSVVAGLLGESKKNMKIDSDESSDQLEIYRPSTLPEKCMIVDTPGLFGDKEKEQDGETVKLSDITKKYIDQANLILYVVEAKNPIKSSHYETVRWILKDLGKLSMTIFVINKMDDVIDVTDDEEYTNMAKIKMNTLRDKVKEVAGLSDSELQDLKICCISSDPGERGFEFWKEHRDAYEKRSHIGTLEKETNAVLQSTSADSLLTEAGYSVLSRLVSDKVATITEQLNLINERILPDLKESIRRCSKDIEDTKRDILRDKTDFKRKINDYEQSLLSELRSTTPETLSAFITDKLGIEDQNVGYRIEQEINLIADETISSSKESLDRLSRTFDKEFAKREAFVDAVTAKAAKLSSTALKSVGKLPLDKMKLAITSGRNVFAKVTGNAIKFKPWGVTKLASGLSKGLPLIGAGIEVLTNAISLWKKNNDNKKFADAVSQLETNITGMFKEVQDSVATDEQFIKQFAPGIFDMERQLEEDKNSRQHYIEQQENIEKWKESAKALLLPAPKA